MINAEKRIPEQNEARSTYPTLYGERQLSADYSNPDRFTTENLVERGRYFALLEMDPETNRRQRAELDLIMTRIAFELYCRNERVAPSTDQSDERA